MGNKVPWKGGMLIYLPVTSRPLISLQKEAVLLPCNFATAHLTACILYFYLPWASRPIKRRTLSQRPILGSQEGTLSGPVLRDTARLSQRYPPHCALWGFWRLNMANWDRAIPPPPFLSVCFPIGLVGAICRTPLSDFTSLCLRVVRVQSARNSY